MSQRFENGHVALVIGCVVCLIALAIVSLTVPYSKGYQAADREHQSAYAEHNSAEEYYEKCVAEPTIQKALECYQQAEDRGREQQAAEQDLDAQREMANWAEGMLWATITVGCITILVTGLGVFWVRQTLVATKNAVKAAYDAVAVQDRFGRLQTQGYLGVHSVNFFFNQDAEKIHSVAVQVHVINTGASPLRIVSQQELAGMAAEPSEIEENWMKVAPQDKFAALPRNATLYIISNNLDWDDVLNAESEGKAFYVRGRLGFEDVFRQRTRYMSYFLSITPANANFSHITVKDPGGCNYGHLQHNSPDDEA